MKAEECTTITPLVIARIRAGLSQSQMAQKINMNEKLYQQKEGGIKYFRLNEMLSISNVTHCSLDELFS